MLKVGILGGGQLGRMLLQAAVNYPVETHVLENDPECPAAQLCHHFTLGDIRNFDDVYAFGRSLDRLTIEIEDVNIEALKKLASEGIVLSLIHGFSALSRIRSFKKNTTESITFLRLHF